MPLGALVAQVLLHKKFHLQTHIRSIKKLQLSCMGLLWQVDKKRSQVDLTMRATDLAPAAIQNGALVNGQITQVSGTALHSPV